MFSGSITALVTPFRNDAIDEPAFVELVKWQIGEGTNGLVPCGTTGEASTLRRAEHERLIRLCVDAAHWRVPVIAGTGTNSTETTVALTRVAKAAGADAALVVTPYYNRPSQEGLFRHFEAVARAVEIPIILYNVPKRTGVDLLPETIGRLARIDTIVGIKDATGDPRRALEIADAAGEGFVRLSGDDATALAFNACSGRGCVSVVANVMPRLCARMQHAWAHGDEGTAKWIEARLAPLVQALSLETNPAPVKYALSQLRGIDPAVRLPMTPVTPETARAIERALRMLEPSPAQDRPAA
jgi:4-hydroxy-tetrahydrodipicolinate synthase